MLPRKKPAQSSGTILEKLNELGIDAEAEADDAVVGQVASSTDVEEIPDDPLDAVDGGLDDDEDDNPIEVSSQPPKSNLRDALFAESQKRPVGRPRKDQTQVVAPIGYSAPSAIPTAIPEISYEPAPHIAVPAPRVAGKVGKAGATAPQAVAARGMGRLAAKMPGAETIVIHKRNDRQQLTMIGRYSPKDLTNYSNVDMFIYDMIKPKFGSGEYQMMGIDPMGREIPAGSCIIEDPPSKTQDQSMAELVEKLINKRDEPVSQQPPINPISMLKDVHELQKSMAQPTPPPVKEDGTIAAVIAAQGQQMQAMMQMMSNQNQQTTQLLIAAMQPREDPTMKMLLAKLVEEKSSSGLGSMPLPPPPPPADPLAGLKDIATLFMPIIAAYLKKDGGDDTKDLLKAIIAQKESDVLKPKDVIDLMMTMQASNKGSDDFRKSMENLQMITQVTKALNPGNEGSSSAGFFDALAALFSNRDFAGSIAQAVRAKAETASRKEVISAETHLLKQKHTMLKEIRQSQPPTAVVRPAQGPVPQPVSPQNVVQMQPRPVQQAQTPPTPQQPQVVPPGVQLPPFPAGTADHVKGLMEAKDDGELLGKTVQMLIYFAEFPEWQPMAEMLLTTIQQGEKVKAINIVRNVFTGFAQLGVLPQELAIRVCNSFIANFEIIQSQISDMNIATEEENPFEAPLKEGEEESDDEVDGEEEGDEEDDDEEEEEAEQEPVAQ